MDDFRKQHCTAAPSSQGQDAWVFDAPSSRAVTARGQAAGPYDVDLYLFDEGCRFLGVRKGSADVLDTPLTKGTQWVVARLVAGSQVRVSLSPSDKLPPGSTPLSTAEERAVPYQWISKSYTESMGRLPTQKEWRAETQRLIKQDCNAASISAGVRQRYMSAEFLKKPYDDAARLLALWRGALNQEPDRVGFNLGLQQLAAGIPWATVVDSVLADARFRPLLDRICGDNPSYYFGIAPALRLPVSGAGFSGGTDVDLQRMLDLALPGDTVYLAQKSVVRVYQEVVVPAGVTLATIGGPPPARYALQGRLVRALPPVVGAAQSSSPDRKTSLVKLMSGARLVNVWVDGQRGDPNDRHTYPASVEGYGGHGTSVIGSTISNTGGWVSIVFYGTAELLPCSKAVISDNLVTSYSSDHVLLSYADGIAVACEDATVKRNQVVDATDVPLILFASGSAPQRSTFRHNVVLSAGNSAYGGMGFEPRTTTDPPGPKADYTRAVFEDNLIWSGARTHFDVGLVVGTRAWHGPGAAYGVGGLFRRNTTGTERIRAALGIGISGMKQVTVVKNTVATEVVDTSLCPQAAVGASVSKGYASGTLQPYTNVEINACVSGLPFPDHNDHYMEGNPIGWAPTVLPWGPGVPYAVDDVAWPSPTMKPAGPSEVYGHLALGNAAGLGMQEFQQSGCAGPPKSQGLDTQVVDIARARHIDVTTSSPSPRQVNLWFFGTNCRLTADQPVSTARSISTPVPAGTRWVAVQLSLGADVDTRVRWTASSRPRA